MRHLIHILLFIFGLSSAAAHGASGITYQGRLIGPDGTPIVSSSVQFKLQIRTPGSEDCLMYEEIQTLDLSTSKGVFALSIADGTGVRQDTNSWGLFDSLANRKSFTFSSSDCTGINTYNPGVTDNRKFRVFFNDGSFSGWEALPIQTINYIPMSIESYAVGGYPASSILKVADSGTLGTTTPLSTAQYNEILALTAGTSTLFERAGRLNGSTIPSLSSGNSLQWNGSAWVAITALTSESDPNVSAFAKASLPTCGSGEVLKADGTSLSCVTDTGGSVDATDTVKGIVNVPTSGGLSVSSGSIGLPDVATAGTSTKVTFDAKGRITSGTTLAESDIPTLSTAGKVSGSAITSGTIAGSTAVSTSGAISTTGNMTATGSITSGSSATRTFDLYDSDNTNYIRFLTPATGSLTSNYSLTFPSALGGANQVLGMNAGGTALENKSVTAGSGVTVTHSAGGIEISATGTGGTVTNVSGTSPISVATGTSTPVISINDTAVTPGSYGSATQVATFTVDQKGRLTAAGNTTITGTSPVGSSLTSGNIWVGNGSNQAAAVAVSGDAALANTGALSVTRIRGTSVNSTAPTASGQVLKYNGSTEYVATYFGVGDLKNSLGNAQFPASCTAAQTLVYSAVTDVYTCSSIAIANTAVSGLGTASTKNFGTSAGNLVELDGGGRIPASLIPTSASGDLSNGGNTTGATVVVGTNDAQSLQLETNNSVAMTILNGGNIGIGTASPGTKLHIAGSGAQLRIQDTANTTASNSLGGIISYRDSAGTEYGWVGDGSGSTNNMAMYSGIGSASLLTTGGSVNLTSAGNVGIGTTNPLRNLSVSGSSVSAGEHRVISAQTSNGNESISLGYDANGTVHTSAFIRTNNIRPLVLGTQTTPSAFTVLDGGNVGIGTTNPSAKLEVVGQIVSQESTLVSGATANFANGNSIVLQSVGGSAITVSNMVAGGTYNVVVEDTTSRTYTFTGCTTSYFSPANGPTINRSIYTIYRRGASSCYISWVTGFN